MKAKRSNEETTGHIRATARSTNCSSPFKVAPLPQWTTGAVTCQPRTTILAPYRGGTTTSIPRMLLVRGAKHALWASWPGLSAPPMLGAPVSLGADASSLPITRSTTPTFSTQTNVPITGITAGHFYEEITPEEGRRLGKGPGNDQDSLPRWLGQQTGEREWVFTPQSGKRPDEDRDASTRWLERRGVEQTLGEAGSVTETEMGRRVGGGIDRLDDSRLNFRSRLGPRPSTGGDVTILTPFSISSMTDTSVDALPTLFLAYCAMDHADSDLAD